MLNVGWAHDWSANPLICPGIESIAMAWCDVPESVGGTTDIILGFNEPNLGNQCNKTFDQTAILWHDLDSKYPDKKLVSPVPYSGDWYGGNPPLVGTAWLREWQAAYQARYGTQPRIDGVQVHCYYLWASQCIATLNEHLAFGKPIWLTEFAFVPTWDNRSQEVLWEQYRQVIQWARAHNARYAAFANRPCNGESWCPPPEWTNPLIDASGNLTFVGQNYRSY